MAGNVLIVVLVAAVAALGCAHAGMHDIYAGYTVHGVQLRDRSDLELIHQLEQVLELDVWQHGMPGVRDAKVMVSPEQSQKFLDELDRSGITHYLELGDVVKALEDFDAETARHRARARARATETNATGRMEFFNEYPRHDEINAYLDRVARDYPDLVTLVDAGPSYEGRTIKYLKISTTNFTEPSKPIFMMDAMIHAREWVTTPVALYSIHRLVEELRGEDRDLLEDVDWIIMPVVNPDGYEFTHTDERLHRRTRSYNPEVSTTCFGVDANRNFDVYFNTVGVSANPCSQTYPGTAPFSEPETRYVRDILYENLSRIQIYMNIHSHGNYVLFGYGFNSTLPANGVHLQFVGAAMGAAMDALKRPEAGYYVVGNSALSLYETSGSAQDYAQYIGVPFSYTLELPGYGYDFSVPVELVDHINEETWQGLAAAARLARTYYAGPY